MERKICFRTSHWLCADPIYGTHGTDPNAMPALADKIQASDIIVYYKDSDMPDWQWNRLKETVDFWVSKGKRVWLMVAKTTLDEPAGTPYSVQHVIDTFGSRVVGVFIDAFETVEPATATPWLLSKKQQLAQAGMECGYYHGDGFAADYGDPSTDVDAAYLSNQGLVPMAWLQNDNSWKPNTFDLPRFWIDYDILAEAEWGGPTGQSYDEIYNRWYLGNVIGKDDLKNNAGCEALVFMVYMADSWPNPDAINGMVAASNNFKEVEMVGYETKTDASGNYQMLMPVGTYVVEASKEGYVKQSATVVVVVNTIKAQDFKLLLAQGVGGTVKDAQGTAIEGAAVKATKQT